MSSILHSIRKYRNNSSRGNPELSLENLFLFIQNRFIVILSNSSSINVIFKSSDTYIRKHGNTQKVIVMPQIL